MSKLIAFRLPDDLVEPLEAHCKSRKLTATSVLSGLVRQMLKGGDASSQDGGTSDRLPIGQRKIQTVRRGDEVVSSRTMRLASYDENGKEVWVEDRP